MCLEGCIEIVDSVGNMCENSIAEAEGSVTGPTRAHLLPLQQVCPCAWRVGIRGEAFTPCSQAGLPMEEQVCVSRACVYSHRP